MFSMGAIHVIGTFVELDGLTHFYRCKIARFSKGSEVKEDLPYVVVWANSAPLRAV